VTRIVETEKDFSIFVSLALLKPYHSQINSYYLRDTLESPSVVAQFQSRKLGSALNHIHLIELANIFVPLPPLEEQDEICLFLEQKMNFIDSQINSVTEAIDRLKEYRTALITNAVTGKIDVRDIKLPETPSSAAA